MVDHNMSVLLQMANDTIISQREQIEEVSELVDALLAILDQHALLPELNTELKTTLETHGFFEALPDHGD